MAISLCDQAGKTRVQRGDSTAVLHSCGDQQGIGYLAKPLNTRQDFIRQIMN